MWIPVNVCDYTHLPLHETKQVVKVTPSPGPLDAAAINTTVTEVYLLAERKKDEERKVYFSRLIEVE